jgi:hypothetical protein
MSKPAKKAKRSREELLRIAKIDNNIIAHRNAKLAC